jgi:ABC-2 type transport system ATP-binding protein
VAEPDVTAPAPAIALEGLAKRFGGRQVLDGLDLEVPAGESFGLVGVNGAGKTTCIKALLDFIDLDAGAIRILGIPHRETRAREPLAFLPERFLPPYYLTGRDFLGCMARLRGAALDPARAQRACTELDLEPAVLDRPVRQYSKGMAQKLGLIACFLSGRQLYVLDEPMSGLDPKARLLVKRVLGRLRGEGCTLFFSTHLLADVAELCDRLGVLHDGRLRYVGTPADFLRDHQTQTLEDAYLRCIS